MKLYLVYLYNPDSSVHDQFFGVFKSKKRFKDEINNISKECDCEISEEDFEVIETRLNQNWFNTSKIII